MTELTKRLRTHAEYADVITPIAQDMLLAADEIERVRGQRPRGKWIVDAQKKTATCSNCKLETYDWFSWNFDYCPDCGADMWGIENE